MVRVLLKHGADDTRAGGPGSMLSTSVVHGKAGLTALLLDRKPASQSELDELLVAAASIQYPEDMVALLLARGADTHFKDRHGYTALEVATSPRVIEMLQKRGATGTVGRKALDDQAEAKVNHAAYERLQQEALERQAKEREKRASEAAARPAEGPRPGGGSASRPVDSSPRPAAAPVKPARAAGCNSQSAGGLLRQQAHCND
jgi:hypothetical protein